MLDKFHVFEGDLYRDGSTLLRHKFEYTFRNIHSVSQFKATLRNGAYAWPGGYPMFFIFSDGAACCFDCARKEFRLIIAGIRCKTNDGWRIIACDINYEDNDCFCANCAKQIESAYGEGN